MLRDNTDLKMVKTLIFIPTENLSERNFELNIQFTRLNKLPGLKRQRKINVRRLFHVELMQIEFYFFHAREHTRVGVLEHHTSL